MKLSFDEVQSVFFGRSKDESKIFTSLKIVQFQQRVVVQFDQLGEAKGVATLTRKPRPFFFPSLSSTRVRRQ